MTTTPESLSQSDRIYDRPTDLPSIHEGSLKWWHVFNDVRIRVKDIEDRYPWVGGGFEVEDRLGVLVEEVGDVACATVNEGFQELYDELADVAAVALRWMFHAAMDDEERAYREYHAETGGAS